MSVPTPGASGPGDSGSVQATFAATLVDEWVRRGVTDAVVCPGSRSTPLALALAARPELRVHVRLDERGAGFFAVGLGLASGRPAVVCTTSGTAAVELHPSVVEAHHAGVPVIVCTADRPPELHGIGAPQTIDQAELYGPVVRWRDAPGVAAADAAGLWRALAARALAEATTGPEGPGPVHLNLAFAEPLVGTPGPLPGPDPVVDEPGAGRSVWAPVARGQRPARWPAGRGVLVAGAGCGDPADVLALAERVGWPVLADPRSGCRLVHPHVVASADALVRVDRLRRHLLPEVVVSLGGSWSSRVLAEFLAEAVRAGAEVLAADPWWRWADPHRALAPERVTAAGLLRELGPAGGPAADPAWLDAWQAAEGAAQSAIERVLADDAGRRHGALSEPAVARLLPRVVGADGWVVAASSMPVRDLEWFAPPLAAPPRVLSNRGVNGIDGVSATALGVAAADAGPVVALLGDLAFLHDASSLVRPAGAPVGGGCTLVVVDNGGGGIFDFLPQAVALDHERFEQLFGTPQLADVAKVAEGFGLAVADVGTPDELAAALQAAMLGRELSVVRARVPDRRENVALHEQLFAAVAAAVGGS